MKKFYNAPELIKEEFVAIDSIMANESLIEFSPVGGDNTTGPF